MPLSSIKSTEKIITPRNFILLDELELVEKSGGYVNGISYGLESYDDNLMLEKWQGFITSDQNIDLVYFIKIFVGSDYPYKPPIITFTKEGPSLNLIKEKLPYLNTSNKNIGQLKDTFPLFVNWNPDLRIKDVLMNLKKYLK